MDTGNLARSLGIGLGIGCAIMFISTMIFLPVSHIMNRNIYHHPVLRGLLGVLTFLVSPIMFFVTLFMRKTHYFGLLPLTKMDGGEYTEGGVILPMLYKIVTVITHPFIEFNGTDEDKVGYDKAIAPLLAAPGAPVVNEELFEAAAAAGAADTQVVWRQKMDGIMTTFGLIPKVAAAVSSLATSVDKTNDILFKTTKLIEGHSYEKIEGTTKESLGIFKGKNRFGSPQADTSSLLFDKDGKLINIEISPVIVNNFDIKEVSP
jgi:hypothetical protein